MHVLGMCQLTAVKILLGFT